MKILEKKLLVILITDNLPNEQTKEKNMIGRDKKNPITD